MTTPLVTLLTLDGEDLNPSGSFTSVVEYGHLGAQTAGANVSTAAREGDGPEYAGVEFEGRDFEVFHTVPESSHETHLAALKALYPPPAAGAQTLVYTDRDGVDKQVTVALVRLTRKPSLSRVERIAFVGIWRLLSVTAVADTAGSVAASSKTSSPATLSVTNAGNVPARQVVHTLKPTAAKSAGNGQRFRRQLTLLYKGERPMVRWPARVLQFDHEAEVTASRSLATGDDIEPYVRGRRQPRWFGSHSSRAANQATTDVWMNIDHPPARYWTYTAGSTLSAGATSVAVPKDSLQGMPALPFHAIWDDSGNEVVLVTGYDAKARTLTVVRGQRGTTAATHTTGKALYWAPWTCDLVYGWTGAASASLWVDDRYKPMCLSTTASASDNSSWYFSSGLAEMVTSGDPALMQPRSGAWEPRLVGPSDRERATGKGDQYWLYGPYINSNPTDRIGVEYAGRKYQGRLLTDGWRLVSPIGISTWAFSWATNLNHSGSMEAGLALWGVDRHGLAQRLPLTSGALRIDASAGGSGSDSLSPARNAYELLALVEPWDPGLDSSFNSASSEPTPAVEPTIGDYCYLDSNVVTFATAERLTFVSGSREDVYQFGRPDAPATLATSLDTLYLDGLVCALSETLSLSASGRSITGANSLPFRHWTRGPIPRLPAGTNNVTLTETGIGTVEMGVSSYRGEWN